MSSFGTRSSSVSLTDKYHPSSSKNWYVPTKPSVELLILWMNWEVFNVMASVCSVTRTVFSSILSILLFCWLICSPKCTLISHRFVTVPSSVLSMSSSLNSFDICIPGFANSSAGVPLQEVSDCVNLGWVTSSCLPTMSEAVGSFVNML